jgi:hypothetical protein
VSHTARNCYTTILRHAAEEQTAEFWAERSLVQNVHSLLLVMCEWLNTRRCPNYFIPDNNTMDHLVNTDVSRDVVALRDAAESLELIANAIQLSTSQETLSRERRCAIEAPRWFFASLTVDIRLCNIIDTHIDLFNHKYSADSQLSLRIQLRNIYLGLTRTSFSVVVETIMN